MEKNPDKTVVKVLFSKPGEWPFWAWLIALVVLGVPNVMTYFGIQIPRLGDGGKSVPQEVAINLSKASESTVEAMRILKDDYQQYKVISEKRMDNFDDKLEHLEKLMRDIDERLQADIRENRNRLNHRDR